MLTATILGSAMAFIDTTVINVALPVMQTELGAGVDDAQWIDHESALTLAFVARRHVRVLRDRDDAAGPARQAVVAIDLVL